MENLERDIPEIWGEGLGFPRVSLNKPQDWVKCRKREELAMGYSGISAISYSVPVLKMLDSIHWHSSNKGFRKDLY